MTKAGSFNASMIQNDHVIYNTCKYVYKIDYMIIKFMKNEMTQSNNLKQKYNSMNSSFCIFNSKHLCQRPRCPYQKSP